MNVLSHEQQFIMYVHLQLYSCGPKGGTTHFTVFLGTTPCSYTENLKYQMWYRLIRRDYTRVRRDCTRVGSVTIHFFTLQKLCPLCLRVSIGYVSYSSVVPIFFFFLNIISISIYSIRCIYDIGFLYKSYVFKKNYFFHRII